MCRLKWPIFESLAVCGMPPVDLVRQARADIGDVFCGNILFGSCIFIAFSVLHIALFLVPSKRLIRLLKKNAPVPKLELYMMIIGFQVLRGCWSSLASQIANA